MSKVCIVDFSQTVIVACAVQMKEIKDSDVDLKPLVKHVAFTMLLNIKKKFGSRIILACDSKNGYWRKDEYQYYKGHRKHENTEFLNWTLVHETINELKQEIREHFSYVLLEVDGAEADDVIAVLCKYYQDNELSDGTLFSEPLDIIIVSNDKDFQQLQKYSNVEQWNNIEKKFILCDDPKKFLEEHIAIGDSGDNIPSITTDDTWSELRAKGISTRAKNFKKTRIEEFRNNSIEACLDDNEKRNWHRNKKLIDFESIPEHINNRIISSYQNYEIKGNRNKVYNYLIKNKMKVLLGSIQDF